MNCMAWRWRLIAVALLLGGAGATQDRPPSQAIGSWVLSCPPTGECQLRHRTWVVLPGVNTPSVALEVVQRGHQFVPVVAIRGLPAEVALGAVLAVQASVWLRFDAAPRVPLDCGLDGGAVVCTPSDAVASEVAGELATAHTVLVQVGLGLMGDMALPEQTRSLELDRTADALAQFRATAPVNEAIPVVPGLDWRGFLDRMARDAGFPQGLAGLLPSVARLVGGQ
jgi:hypothetical protein